MKIRRLQKACLPARVFYRTNFPSCSYVLLLTFAYAATYARAFCFVAPPRSCPPGPAEVSIAFDYPALKKQRLGACAGLWAECGWQCQGVNRAPQSYKAVPMVPQLKTSYCTERAKQLVVNNMAVVEECADNPLDSLDACFVEFRAGVISG